MTIEMKKYAVVRKESGIVYYEWFKELADAVKRADKFAIRGIEANVILSDEFKQEFTFGRAWQENRKARIKKGYLLKIGGVSVSKYYWICRIENGEVAIDSFCSKTTAMAFFKSAKKQGKSPIMLVCGRYDGGYAICYAIDRAKALDKAKVLGCICKSSFEEFHCEE